jgi:hypothetical protein
VPEEHEPMPELISYRRRINVSVSVKGVKTFDCTCESDGGNLMDLLIESDKMVKALSERYPIIPKETKKENKWIIQP